MKKIKTLFLLMCLVIPFMFVGCANEEQSSLATPNNFSVNDGVIVFEAVRNTDYYTVAVNDFEFVVDVKYNKNVQIIDGNIHYNGSNIFIIGNSYIIKVKAKSNHEDFVDSAYTEEQFYIHSESIKKPTGVKFVNNILSWNCVNSANEYKVKLTNLSTGAEEEITCTTNSCNLTSKLASNNAGDYSLCVKALRYGLSPEDSGYTSPITIINQKGLLAPTVSKLYESSGSLFVEFGIDNNATGITVYYDVQFRTAVFNGTDASVTEISGGYKINLNTLFGLDFNDNDPNQETIYSFRFQSVYETAGNRYYSNSEITNKFNYSDKQEVVLNKLEAPTNVRIEKIVTIVDEMEKVEYKLSWSAVDNCVGYMVRVYYGGNVFKDLYLNSNNLTYIIADDNFGKASVFALSMFEDTNSNESIQVAKPLV